jgi:peptidoglycan/LPS O-acetylase OafA/YrhL
MKQKLIGTWAIILLSATITILIPNKQFIFAHAPFFWCGIALFLLKIRKIRGAGVLLIILVNLLLVLKVNDVSYVSAGIFACLVIAFTSFNQQIWQFLGSVSYSLYLLHVPIGQRIMNFAENLITNQYALMVFMFMCVGVMLVISWLYRILIEGPSHSLSKKISL